MAALIDRIGPPLPDPDKPDGRIYGRFLTTSEKISALPDWGEVGELIMRAAIRTADAQFCFSHISVQEEWINKESK